MEAVAGAFVGGVESEFEFAAVEPEFEGVGGAGVFAVTDTDVVKSLEEVGAGVDAVVVLVGMDFEELAGDALQRDVVRGLEGVGVVLFGFAGVVREEAHAVWMGRILLINCRLLEVFLEMRKARR